MRLSDAGDNRHVMVTKGDSFLTYDTGRITKGHGDHNHYYTAEPSLGVTGKIDSSWEVSSTNTASELVQRGQTKTISIKDNHDRSIRNVNANLNDSCGDQNLRLICAELFHNLIFLCLRQSTRQKIAGKVFKNGL